MVLHQDAIFVAVRPCDLAISANIVVKIFDKARHDDFYEFRTDPITVIAVTGCRRFPAYGHTAVCWTDQVHQGT